MKTFSSPRQFHHEASVPPSPLHFPNSENMDPSIFSSTEKVDRPNCNRNLGLRSNDSWRNQNNERLSTSPSNPKETCLNSDHFQRLSFSQSRGCQPKEDTIPTDNDVSLFINNLLRNSQFTKSKELERVSNSEAENRQLTTGLKSSNDTLVDLQDTSIDKYPQTTNISSLNLTDLPPMSLLGKPQEEKYLIDSKIWKAHYHHPASVSRPFQKVSSNEMSLDRPSLIKKQEHSWCHQAVKLELPKGISPWKATNNDSESHLIPGESSLPTETTSCVETSPSTKPEEISESSLFTEFGSSDSGSPLFSSPPKTAAGIQFRDVVMSANPGEKVKTSLWFGTNSHHPFNISANILFTKFDAFGETSLMSKDATGIFEVEQDSCQKLRNVREFVVSFRPSDTGLYTAILHLKSRKKVYQSCYSGAHYC